MHYRRTNIPGMCYFFTVNLAERKRTLLIDEISKLKAAFYKVKHKNPFQIDAIVVLPDHLHMIMTLPVGDSNYSQRLNLIKGNFSRQIASKEKISLSRRKKRERGIWQRRFWEHLIRNEDDYERHINYIHYNPVKHGYVKIPADWRYSSIHRYIAKGILSPNWASEEDFFDSGFGE